MMHERTSAGRPGRWLRVPGRLLAALALLGWPALSPALTPDRGRPFGDGEVLGFPGADYFAGDLSHELRVADPLLARETLDRWPLLSLSRANPFAPGGGTLLFEGLACPLPGLDLDGVLAAGAGTVEVHDFPAAAWWGPAAAGGAAQLRAPLFDPDTKFIAGAWGGVPRRAGVHLRFPGERGTLAAAFRTRDDRIPGSTDAWTVTGRSRREWRGDTRLAAGGLDLRTLSGSRWTSLYGEVRSGVGAFNEWLVRPFLQRASSGDREAGQAGFEGRTLFNMAGFVESQWSGGVDRTLVREGVGERGRNRAFLQNTESFDALGIVMGDLALRGDFATGREPRLALASGLQGHYGALGLHGSSERSDADGEPSHFRQDRAGFRFVPSDDLDAGVHLAAGVAPLYGGFHGPGAHLAVSSGSPPLPWVRRLSARVEAESLLTSYRARLDEAAGSVEARTLPGTILSFRARALKGSRPSWEAALDHPVAGGLFADARFFRLMSPKREDAWSAGARYEW